MLLRAVARSHERVLFFQLCMYGGSRGGHMWTLVRLFSSGWPRGEEKKKKHGKFVYGLDRLGERLADQLAGWWDGWSSRMGHGDFDQALDDADIAKDGLEPPCMVAGLGRMPGRRTGAARYWMSALTVLDGGLCVCVCERVVGLSL
ncbi:uncharacterized protein LY79DRAFT_570683 [Colletotrichum navitas]|uniref:Uncharacterized protein n=1 Tax=Colletotrichum navitas TaxID=681940 RepID=A0AAD8UZJ7_9PEZI|nr:uncharacterized protein LY79DRAFT_570683 [Colletotrichum navitas]KAK1570003.1 hypothetical protein LY79DRAFT_570683 [Colletotrichum navitas]